MNKLDLLTEEFQNHRSRLRAVAYRMLGSVTEAEDAVQEAWLRLNRSDSSVVGNMGAWLATIVGRICLDMLRARKLRREESLDSNIAELKADLSRWADPEGEAIMADSVGLALFVVLDTLSPTERLAFVLHDAFGMSFDEIAPIVGRTTVAAKKLASRARQRVRGREGADSADLRRQRAVVETFLCASRSGDVNGLLAVLDPNVVRRADRSALATDAEPEVHGASNVVRETVTNAGLAQHARVALVNDGVGLIVILQNRVRVALTFSILNEKITAIDVIADPIRLRALKLSVLEL